MLQRALLSVLVLLPLLCPVAARSEPRLMSDRDLSAVHGGEDPSSGAVIPALPGSPNGPLSQIASHMASGAISTVLTADQARAALAAAGITPGSVYTGQPVIQMQLTAEPFTISFDLGALLASLAGSDTLHGPSMGTMTLSSFDARGTTLWVWGH